MRPSALVVVFGALVLSSAKAQAPLTLAAPPGPFSVGTATYEVADPARPEVATPDPYDLRTITLQVWYPAAPEPAGPPAPYVPDVADWAAVYSPEFVRLLGRVRTNSQAVAVVSDARARYPVVLFSSGFGMSRHFYTTLLEGLASHGFVAVAIDRPYLNTVRMRDGAVRSPRGGFWDAFPATKGIDSLDAAIRQLRFSEGYLVADQALALAHLARLARSGSGDRLEGRLDLGHVVNLAHSAGGMPGRALIVDPEAPYAGYVFYDGKIHITTGSPTVSIPVEGVVEKPVLAFFLEYAYPPPEAFAAQLRAPLVLATMAGASHNSIADLDYLTALRDGDAEVADVAHARLRTLLEQTVAFVRSTLNPASAFPLPTTNDALLSVEVMVPAQN